MMDPADRLFNCTPRDRALFEAGIKMGGIFHQYIGIPLSISNVRGVESMIRDSVLVQPYVSDVQVSIDRDAIPKGSGTYDYTTLSGEMLDVSVTLEFDGHIVKARMRYVHDMKYPLMYIESVVKMNDKSL